MLGHAFLAKVKAPEFAPSMPCNRSCTSVPVTRGRTNRQYADRAAHPTNPQKIATRRMLRADPASHRKRPYAAPNRIAPGKSSVKATHAKPPAVRKPRGPSRFSATARIQIRFVASRRADAHNNRVAESPSNRWDCPRYSKPASRPEDSGLARCSKGFLPRGGMFVSLGGSAGSTAKRLRIQQMHEDSER